jgi:uncharacterized damage-inducible protein DinB
MTMSGFRTLPYIHLLQKREPLEVLAASQKEFSRLLHPLSMEQVQRKVIPGKWNVRETMAHLADCEIAWSWRFRQIYGDDNPTIEPFDQDAWAESYDNYPFVQAQTSWGALRAWNLIFLSTLSMSDRLRPAMHPEFGPVKLWTLVSIAAGHDLHHLQRLELYLDAMRKAERESPATDRA